MCPSYRDPITHRCWSAESGQQVSEEEVVVEGSAQQAHEGPEDQPIAGIEVRGEIAHAVTRDKLYASNFQIEAGAYRGQVEVLGAAAKVPLGSAQRGQDAVYLNRTGVRTTVLNLDTNVRQRRVDTT